MSEARKPDAMWKGLPVYKCRHCRLYERVGDQNLEAVLDHERSKHSAAVHPSGLVDTMGAPLMVAATDSAEEEK